MCGRNENDGYVRAAYSVEKNIRFGEYTAIICLEHYFQGAVVCFEGIFLRENSDEDITMLLCHSEDLIFTVMLGPT